MKQRTTHIIFDFSMLRPSSFRRSFFFIDFLPLQLLTCLITIALLLTALPSFGESVTVPVAYGNSYTLTVTGGTAITQSGTIYVCTGNEYNFTVIPHTTGTWTAYASPASGTIAPDGSQTTINVSTITYTPGPDEPASETEFSVEVSVGVIKVEIEKFSPPYTYVRHPDCSKENHQSTCHAKIIPEAASSEIVYSIQGKTYGAEIDEKTGVITPGMDESGKIKIRATAEILPDCYDEKELEIKARPTKIVASECTLGLPCGGEWTHTFGSTGGSLNGEHIKEEVRAGTWPFRNPEFESGGTWVLDDKGKMEEPDIYYAPPEDFFVTDFFPDPPKGGLPQEGFVIQEYFWQCPSCLNVQRQVSVPTKIAHKMIEMGKSVIVRLYTGYKAVGEPLDFKYGGPAYIDDLQLKPSSIPADGKSKSRGMVTVIPKDRDVNWSIIGDDLGVKISGNVFTAGTKTGTVLIKAEDTLSSNFDTGLLELTEPKGKGKWEL